MNTTTPSNEPSDLDLEAMLYVLRDPAIDSDAFEARMIEDQLLAEAVSNAVFLALSIKQGSEATVQCQLPSNAASSIEMPRISFDPTWVALATLSAVVSLFLLSLDYSSTDNSAEPMYKVAVAWTDLQTTSMEAQNADLKNGTTLLNLSESDEGFLGLEQKSLDDDLPDWMLLATIASDSMKTEMVQ